MKIIMLISYLLFMSFSMSSQTLLILKKKNVYQVFDFTQKKIVYSFSSVNAKEIFSKAFKMNTYYYLQTSNFNLSHFLLSSFNKMPLIIKTYSGRTDSHCYETKEERIEIQGTNVSVNELFYDSLSNVIEQKHFMISKSELWQKLESYPLSFRTLKINDMFAQTKNGKLYLVENNKETLIADNSDCYNVNPKILCGYYNPSMNSGGTKILCNFLRATKHSTDYSSIIEFDLRTKKLMNSLIDGENPQYSPYGDLILYRAFDGFFYVYNPLNRDSIRLPKCENTWWLYEQ